MLVHLVAALRLITSSNRTHYFSISCVDTTKVLIDKADYICKVPVELFNTEDNSDKTRLDSHTPRLDSHTPWKGNVSDKIRGTWTRIMGKRNGYLKSDEGTV